MIGLSGSVAGCFTSLQQLEAIKSSLDDEREATQSQDLCMTCARTGTEHMMWVAAEKASMADQKSHWKAHAAVLIKTSHHCAPHSHQQLTAHSARAYAH